MQDKNFPWDVYWENMPRLIAAYNIAGFELAITLGHNILIQSSLEQQQSKK